MPEQENKTTIPTTAHDRVKKGYWPEKAGDQVITIDVDHLDADKVVEKLPENWREIRERYIADQPKREAAAAKAERDARVKAQREREAAQRSGK